jgi:hypothetical protein
MARRRRGAALQLPAKVWFKSSGVPSTGNPVVVVLAVLAGLVVLRLQIWRALLFITPTSVRVEAEEPSSVVVVPGALEPAVEALRTLGFVLVGTHSESPRLTRGTRFIDLLEPTTGTWASVAEGRRARVSLLSCTAQGWVVTSDFRRPSSDVAGALAGAIEGASPERLLKAHLRLVQAPEPVAHPTLEARVELARAWFAGPGRAELRQQHAIGLLWSLGALALMGAPFFASSP